MRNHVGDKRHDNVTQESSILVNPPPSMMMMVCGGSQSPVILLWLLGFHICKQPSLSPSANFETEVEITFLISLLIMNRHNVMMGNYVHILYQITFECRSQVMRKAGVKMLICRVPMT